MQESCEQSWRDRLVKYHRFSWFRMDLDNEAYSVLTALGNINTTSSIVFIAHKNYTRRVCRLALFLSMDINIFRNRKWIERFWLRYMPFINQTLTIVETSISLRSLTPSQSQTSNGYIFELTWTANRADDSQGSLYKHGENLASLESHWGGQALNIGWWQVQRGLRCRNKYILHIFSFMCVFPNFLVT